MPRRLRVRLLHGIESLEFDTRIRRAELPVDRAHLLVAVVLPLLDLLTELLKGGNVVGQTLPRQHAQFALADIEPARVLGRAMALQATTPAFVPLRSKPFAHPITP